jgi:hypothetical protein
MWQNVTHDDLRTDLRLFTQYGLDQHRRIATRRKLEFQPESARKIPHSRIVRSHPQRAPRASQSDAAGWAKIREANPTQFERSLLAQCNFTRGLDDTVSEDGAGRADLESRRSRLLSLDVFDQELPTRTVKHRDVAEFEFTDARRPGGENIVENRRLQSGYRKTRLAPIFQDDLAAQEAGTYLDIPARTAEPLRPEHICHSDPTDLGELRARRFPSLVVDTAHGDFESVPTQLPGAQFMSVQSRLEHANAFEPEIQRPLRIEARHGKPLGGYGKAVLAARVTDIARTHTRGARERAGDFLGRDESLLDTHEGVFALAARRIQRQLFDAKIFGFCANARHRP